MRASDRQRFKSARKITESDDSKWVCKKCLYHTYEKICQVHGIKTKVDEVCPGFTPKRKHKVFRGGGVSPK